MSAKDDLISVLSSLPSSSSGTGISYYNTRCPRQAQLDKQFPRGSSYNAEVGVVFHKLMELYYARELADVVLPLDDAPQADDAVQEALRLFAGYAGRFPHDEWNVVGCEVLLPYKNDRDMASLIEQAVGVSPFTGRLDMVVELTEEHLAGFSERRRMDLRPGKYIVDHKTSDKKDSKAALKYSRSPQFSAYQLAFNAAFGPHDGDMVRGVIVNNCVWHKKLTNESFTTFFVPPPTETQVNGLRKWLAYKQEFLRSDVCDWSACEDWGGCSHYINGLCARV